MIIISIITFVAGFIVGALVFRNNAAKGEAVVKKTESDLKSAYESASIKVKNFKK